MTAICPDCGSRVPVRMPLHICRPRHAAPDPATAVELHARIVGGLVVEYLIVPVGHVEACAVWRGSDVDAARRERDRLNAEHAEDAPPGDAIVVTESR